MPSYLGQWCVSLNNLCMTIDGQLWKTQTVGSLTHMLVLRYIICMYHTLKTPNKYSHKLTEPTIQKLYSRHAGRISIRQSEEVCRYTS